MAIKKKGLNPITLAQKPMLDASPVRHVLNLLQCSERQSEQPAEPVPDDSVHEHQNEHVNTQSSTKKEEIVSESLTFQPDDCYQGSPSSRGGDADALSCPNCSKRFLSGASLRKHLAKLYPCDQPRYETEARECKVESKTCFKCGKTFASWQGLRNHLNRIKPCDQEKLVSTVIHRHPPASKACFKCGKIFSSPQSLRIHMNRVKPCGQDPKNGLESTTSPGTTTLLTIVKPLSSDKLKKEADRKVKARYHARKAYLKKRGRLGELGDPPSAICQSGDDVNQTQQTEPGLDLKRNAPDETFCEGDNVGTSSRGVKRPRVQEKPAQEDELAGSPSDVSGLTQPCTPTSSHTASNEASTTGVSFLHRPNNGHGGDLLKGGCSCPPCVRRWARKLMNRMQQLEDEVMMLRQKVAVDAYTTRAARTKPYVGPEASQRQPESLLSLASTDDCAVGIKGIFQAEPADIIKSLVNFSDAAAASQSPLSISGVSTKPTVLLQHGGQSLQVKDLLGGLQRVDDGDEHQSVIASVLQGVNSDTKILMDAYKHMNDQILLNERAVKESSGHIQALVGCSPTAAMDFRKQVDELRASIGAEKIKREATVAAVIAHVWKPRCEEFKELLNAQCQSSPRDEQVYHTKLAEIASQLVIKEKVIFDLERQMEALGESGGNSRSRYTDMGELSSKIAAEYAAKMALESEREGFYVGLVKSNTRIWSLVRNALS